jgi:hypothetical protein
MHNIKKRLKNKGLEVDNKKSFILYLDQKELFDSLPDEIAGKLIKHIFSYVNCEEPVSDDLIITVAFASIKQSLKRDLKKWESSINQRSEAGKISAAKRAERKANEAPTNPTSVESRSTATNEVPTNPTVSGSVSVSDSVSVSVNVSDSVSDKDKRTTALSLDFSQFDFTNNQIEDLKRIRKANKGTKLTQRIVNAMAKEFKEASAKGYSFDELLTEWEVRGWKSFKADWITDKPGYGISGMSKLGQKSWNNIKDTILE